jgi:hypothetical protein
MSHSRAHISFEGLSWLTVVVVLALPDINVLVTGGGVLMSKSAGDRQQAKIA